MKKSMIVGCILFSQALFSGEIMYATSVIGISDSQNSSISGKLLPTSKVQILEKVGDKIKFKVQGFVKDGATNAVYFVPNKRILVTAFAKKNNYKFEKIATKDGWDEVSVIGYAKNENFTKDLDGLYKKAKATYTENCSMCHPLHPENEFSANQWPSMIKSMVNRTPMSKDQNFLVVQYLQKHAKDMKGE